MVKENDIVVFEDNWNNIKILICECMKTINVTNEFHTKLTHLGLKSDIQWIIVRLIVVYERMYFDELNDEESIITMKELNSEYGDYAGIRKVDLNAIRK